MRGAATRISGVRDGRLMSMCSLCSFPFFCPCSMPKVLWLRQRMCQRVATSFLRWCDFDEIPSGVAVRAAIRSRMGQPRAGWR